ncbi:hypothetical protein [Mycobacterium sp. 852002-50816_SCH5313054-b]|uniref:hypothetical protein n=1 Tax=Mycobacterium sp. 852002-50816_SCH5313054-b TaxID=1834092 RepID=UPI000B1F44CF|nr:hypothetical protein [Mycobacterium sp. 852002-50816_SCH5313054-b]
MTVEGSTHNTHPATPPSVLHRHPAGVAVGSGLAGLVVGAFGAATLIGLWAPPSPPPGFGFPPPPAGAWGPPPPPPFAWHPPPPWAGPPPPGQPPQPSIPGPSGGPGTPPSSPPPTR